MYSVKIANTSFDAYSGGVEKLVAGAYFNRYFTIYTTNIVQYPDGTIGWGNEDPDSLEFKHTINTKNLENLVNENVTSKKAEYNVTTISELFK